MASIAESFAAVVREEMARPTFSGGASTKQSWEHLAALLGFLLGEAAPEEITRRRVSDSPTSWRSPLSSARGSRINQRDWSLPRLVEAYAEQRGRATVA